MKTLHLVGCTFVLTLAGCNGDTTPASPQAAAPPGASSSAPAATPAPASATSATPASAPADGQPWRSDPRLRGRFHPEYPDDLQVVAHDGGPRITKHRPEAVWVRVVGEEGKGYRGQILNVPTNLTSVKQGDVITFIIPKGIPHGLMVTEKYLRERPEWVITPCDKCGLDELFDAPSDLMRVIFPNLPAGSTMEAFTTFCPACGGVITVQSIHSKMK